MQLLTAILRMCAQEMRYSVCFSPCSHHHKLTDDGCAANPVGPVDREGLEELLRRLDKVDLDSLSRVADSKVR